VAAALGVALRKHAHADPVERREAVRLERDRRPPALPYEGYGRTAAPGAI
jgi:hypothetical protein